MDDKDLSIIREFATTILDVKRHGSNCFVCFYFLHECFGEIITSYKNNEIEDFTIIHFIVDFSFKYKTQDNRNTF